MANKIKIEVDTLLDLKVGKTGRPNKLLKKLESQAGVLAKHLENELGKVEINPELVVDFNINKKLERLAPSILDSIVKGFGTRFPTFAGGTNLIEGGKRTKSSTLPEVAGFKHVDSDQIGSLFSKVEGAINRNMRFIERENSRVARAGESVEEGFRSLFQSRQLVKELKSQAIEAKKSSDTVQANLISEGEKSLHNTLITLTKKLDEIEVKKREQGRVSAEQSLIAEIAKREKVTGIIQANTVVDAKQAKENKENLQASIRLAKKKLKEEDREFRNVKARAVNERKREGKVASTIPKLNELTKGIDKALSALAMVESFGRYGSPASTQKELAKLENRVQDLGQDSKKDIRAIPTILESVKPILFDLRKGSRTIVKEFEEFSKKASSKQKEDKFNEVANTFRDNIKNLKFAELDELVTNVRKVADSNLTSLQSSKLIKQGKLEKAIDDLANVGRSERVALRTKALKSDLGLPDFDKSKKDSDLTAGEKRTRNTGLKAEAIADKLDNALSQLVKMMGISPQLIGSQTVDEIKLAKQKTVKDIQGIVGKEPLSDEYKKVITRIGRNSKEVLNTFAEELRSQAVLLEAKFGEDQRDRTDKAKARLESVADTLVTRGGLTQKLNNINTALTKLDDAFESVAILSGKNPPERLGSSFISSINTEAEDKLTAEKLKAIKDSIEKQNRAEALEEDRIQKKKKAKVDVDSSKDEAKAKQVEQAEERLENKEKANKRQESTEGTKKEQGKPDLFDPETIGNLFKLRVIDTDILEKQNKKIKDIVKEVTDTLTLPQDNKAMDKLLLKRENSVALIKQLSEDINNPNFPNNHKIAAQERSANTSASNILKSLAERILKDMDSIELISNKDKRDRVASTLTETLKTLRSAQELKAESGVGKLDRVLDALRVDDTTLKREKLEEFIAGFRNQVENQKKIVDTIEKVQLKTIEGALGKPELVTRDQLIKQVEALTNQLSKAKETKDIRDKEVATNDLLAIAANNRDSLATFLERVNKRIEAVATQQESVFNETEMGKKLRQELTMRSRNLVSLAKGSTDKRKDRNAVFSDTLALSNLLPEMTPLIEKLRKLFEGKLITIVDTEEKGKKDTSKVSDTKKKREIQSKPVKVLLSAADLKRIDSAETVKELRDLKQFISGELGKDNTALMQLKLQKLLEKTDDKLTKLLAIEKKEAKREINSDNKLEKDSDKKSATRTKKVKNKLEVDSSELIKKTNDLVGLLKLQQSTGRNLQAKSNAKNELLDVRSDPKLENDSESKKILTNEIRNLTQTIKQIRLQQTAIRNKLANNFKPSEIKSERARLLFETRRKNQKEAEKVKSKPSQKPINTKGEGTLIGGLRKAIKDGFEDQVRKESIQSKKENRKKASAPASVTASTTELSGIDTRELKKAIQGCCKKLNTNLINIRKILRTIVKDGISFKGKAAKSKAYSPRGTSSKTSTQTKELSTKVKNGVDSGGGGSADQRQSQDSRDSLEDIARTLRSIGDIDNKNLAQVIALKQQLSSLSSRLANLTTKPTTEAELRTIGKLAEQVSSKLANTNKVITESKKFNDRETNIAREIFDKDGKVGSLKDKTPAQLNLIASEVVKFRDIAKDRFEKSKGNDIKSERLIDTLTIQLERISDEVQRRKERKEVNKLKAEVGTGSEPAKLRANIKLLKALIKDAENKGDSREFLSLEKSLAEANKELRSIRKLTRSEESRLAEANRELVLAGVGKVKADNAKDVARAETLVDNLATVLNIAKGATTFDRSTPDKEREVLKDFASLRGKLSGGLDSSAGIANAQRQLRLLDVDQAREAAYKIQAEIIKKELASAYAEALKEDRDRQLKADKSSTQKTLNIGSVEGVSEITLKKIDRFNALQAETSETNIKQAERAGDTSKIAQQVRLLKEQAKFLSAIESGISDSKDLDNIAKTLRSTQSETKRLSNLIKLSKNEEDRLSKANRELVSVGLGKVIAGNTADVIRAEKLADNVDLALKIANRATSFDRATGTQEREVLKAFASLESKFLGGIDAGAGISNAKRQLNLLDFDQALEVAYKQQANILKKELTEAYAQALKEDARRTIKANQTATEKSLKVKSVEGVSPTVLEKIERFNTLRNETTASNINDAEASRDTAKLSQQVRLLKEQAKFLSAIEAGVTDTDDLETIGKAIAENVSETKRLQRQVSLLESLGQGAETEVNRRERISSAQSLELRADRLFNSNDSAVNLFRRSSIEDSSDINFINAQNIKKEFDKLTGSTSALLNTLNDQRASIRLNIENTDRSSDSFQELERELKDVEKELADVEALRSRVLQSSNQFVNKDFREARITDAIDQQGLLGSAAIQGQGSLLLSQFARLALGFDALSSSVGLLSEFGSQLLVLDANLKSIQAAALTTSESMENIRASILKVATTTKFSVGEISEAAKILVQADVKPDELPETLRATSLFGAATDSTLAVAADLITSFRNVFSSFDDIEAANLLTKTINLAKLTSEELKVIVGIGAQVSKDVGLSAEQFLAAVVSLRNQGLKASTTATGLRQAQLELFSPDKKTLDTLVARYAEIGENLSDIDIFKKFTSFKLEDNALISVLTELKRLGIQGGAKDIFARTFDVRALNAILPLINDLEALAGKEIQLPFGESALIGADIQLQSLEASVLNLGAALSALGDDVFRPVIEGLAETATEATETLGKIKELNQEANITGEGGLGSVLTLSALTGALGATFGKTLIGKAGLAVAGAAGGATVGATSLQSGGLSVEDGVNAGVAALTIASLVKSLGIMGKSSIRLREATGNLPRITGDVSNATRRLSGLAGVISTIASFIPQLRVAGIVLAGVTAALSFAYLRQPAISDSLNALAAKEQEFRIRIKGEFESLSQAMGNVGTTIASAFSLLRDKQAAFRNSLLSSGLIDENATQANIDEAKKLIRETIEGGSETTTNAYKRLKDAIGEGRDASGAVIGAEISKLIQDYNAFTQGAAISIEEVRNYVRLAEDAVNPQISQQIILESVERLRLTSADLFETYLGLGDVSAEQIVKLTNKLDSIQKEIAREKFTAKIKEQNEEILKNQATRLALAEKQILQLRKSTGEVKRSKAAEELAKAIVRSGGTLEDYLAAVSKVIKDSRAKVKAELKRTRRVRRNLNAEGRREAKENANPTLNIGEVAQFQPDALKNTFRVEVAQLRAELIDDLQIDKSSKIAKETVEKFKSLPFDIQKALLNINRENADLIKQRLGVDVDLNITELLGEIANVSLEVEPIEANIDLAQSGQVVKLGDNNEVKPITADSTEAEKQRYLTLRENSRELLKNGSELNSASKLISKLAGVLDLQNSRAETLKNIKKTQVNDTREAAILKELLNTNPDDLLLESKKIKDREKFNANAQGTVSDGRFLTDEQLDDFRLPSSAFEASLLTDEEKSIIKAILSQKRDELTALKVLTAKSLRETSTERLDEGTTLKRIAEIRKLEDDLTKFSRASKGLDPDPAASKRAKLIEENKRAERQNTEENRKKKALKEAREFTKSTIKAADEAIATLKIQLEELIVKEGKTPENAEERIAIRTNINSVEAIRSDEKEKLAKLTTESLKIEIDPITSLKAKDIKDLKLEKEIAQQTVDTLNKRFKEADDKITDALTAAFTKKGVATVDIPALRVALAKQASQFDKLIQQGEINNDLVDIAKLRLKQQKRLLEVNTKLREAIRSKLLDTEAGQFAVGVSDRLDAAEESTLAEEGLNLLDNTSSVIGDNIRDQIKENRANGDDFLEAIRNFKWSSLRDAIRSSIADTFFNLAKKALNDMILKLVNEAITAFGFPTKEAKAQSERAKKEAILKARHDATIESTGKLIQSNRDLIKAINNIDFSGEGGNPDNGNSFSGGFNFSGTSGGIVKSGSSSASIGTQIATRVGATVVNEVADRVLGDTVDDIVDTVSNTASDVVSTVGGLLDFKRSEPVAETSPMLKVQPIEVVTGTMGVKAAGLSLANASKKLTANSVPIKPFKDIDKEFTPQEIKARNDAQAEADAKAAEKLLSKPQPEPEPPKKKSIWVRFRDHIVKPVAAVALGVVTGGLATAAGAALGGLAASALGSVIGTASATTIGSAIGKGLVNYAGRTIAASLLEPKNANNAVASTADTAEEDAPLEYLKFSTATYAAPEKFTKNTLFDTPLVRRIEEEALINEGAKRGETEEQVRKLQIFRKELEEATKVGGVRLQQAQLNLEEAERIVLRGGKPRDQTATTSDGNDVSNKNTTRTDQVSESGSSIIKEGNIQAKVVTGIATISSTLTNAVSSIVKDGKLVTSEIPKGELAEISKHLKPFRDRLREVEEGKATGNGIFGHIAAMARREADIYKARQALVSADKDIKSQLNSGVSLGDIKQPPPPQLRPEPVKEDSKSVIGRLVNTVRDAVSGLSSPDKPFQEDAIMAENLKPFRERLSLAEENLNKGEQGLGFAAMVDLARRNYEVHQARLQLAAEEKKERMEAERRRQAELAEPLNRIADATEATADHDGVSDVVINEDSKGVIVNAEDTGSGRADLPVQKFSKGVARFGKVTPGSTASVDTVAGLGVTDEGLSKVLLAGGESVLTANATSFLGESFINSVNRGITPPRTNLGSSSAPTVNVNVPPTEPAKIIIHNLIDSDNIAQALDTPGGRQGVREIVNDVNEERSIV